MKMKKVTAFMMTAALAASVLAGCGSGSEKQVVIYSNADDEAVEAMKETLDANGYEGKYLFQTFGTSELGGKLLAEGKDIEADMVTMSSFYLDSAQEQNNMFLDLTFDYKTLTEYPAFYAPITSQEGAIILNTEMLSENNLDRPESLKDLTKPEYKDLLSVTDIKSSSTAWLLMQALVSEYGENGAKDVLKGIYENAGAHIESSGSAPLKKIRAGEVAVGFGLRHQAVADKKEANPLAMEMAQCIVEKGRSELIRTYPNPIYEGEEADPENMSAYPKVFPEKLTVSLLERHQELSEECK